MTDYVKLWDDYSIQFNKTLEYDFNGDWNQLDQEEREIMGFGNYWWMDITAVLSNFSAIGDILDIGMLCVACKKLKIGTF